MSTTNSSAHLTNATDTLVASVTHMAVYLTEPNTYPSVDEFSDLVRVAAACGLTMEDLRRVMKSMLETGCREQAAQPHDVRVGDVVMYHRLDGEQVAGTVRGLLPHNDGSGRIDIEAEDMSGTRSSGAGQYFTLVWRDPKARAASETSATTNLHSPGA